MLTFRQSLPLPQTTPTTPPQSKHPRDLLLTHPRHAIPEPLESIPPVIQNSLVDSVIKAHYNRTYETEEQRMKALKSMRLSTQSMRSILRAHREGDQKDRVPEIGLMGTVAQQHPLSSVPHTSDMLPPRGFFSRQIL
eukprot:PhF_6_TR34581/c0_g1_i1/m.50364